MSIKDIIPAVVEEIVEGIQASQAKGICVTAPQTVQITMPAPHGAAATVTLTLLN